MAYAFIPNDSLKSDADSLYLNQNFTVFPALASGLNVATASLQDWITKEIVFNAAPGNQPSCYRKLVTPTESAVTSNIYATTPKAVLIAANRGVSITYDTIVIASNVNNYDNGGDITGPALLSAVSGNVVTVLNGNQLANGNKVVFKTGNFTGYTGLTDGTVYVLSDKSSNTFKLKTLGGSYVTITNSTNYGGMLLPAEGVLRGVLNVGSTTINAGDAVSYNLIFEAGKRS